MSLFSDSAELTEDQRMLIDAVGEFAESELLPLDRKWDKDETSAVEVLPQLSEMGLMSLCLPEELNGLGCTYQTYAAILHEIARSSPSTCVTISVHSLTGYILLRNAPEPLRTELLSAWGDPANFAAFAISEADAGSDSASIKTTATEVDGGFRITGEKMWITNGMAARWFLTLVKLKGTTGREALHVVLIDGESKGVGRTKIHGKMGIRGSETAVIALDDVFVPSTHFIGERGNGLRVMLAGLNQGRIGIAAQSTGIAEACLTEMVAYAREREQFGRQIGRFQAIGDMIANTAVELEAAKMLVLRAAAGLDAGAPKSAHSSMAKLYASECCNRAAYRAVQVFGGTGYVNECRAEQLFRDARVTTIYEGSSEIQRIVIARQLARGLAVA